jgi:hypothetical protein
MKPIHNEGNKNQCPPQLSHGRLISLLWNKGLTYKTLGKTCFRPKHSKVDHYLHQNKTIEGWLQGKTSYFDL